jgi:hypothetical protein
MDLIKQRCSGFETPEGLMMLYDHKESTGYVWRPDPGLWTCWKPVAIDAFLAAAKLMADEMSDASETTEAIIKRMMH